MSLFPVPSLQPGSRRWCLHACPHRFPVEGAGQPAPSPARPLSVSSTLKIQDRSSPQQWFLGPHEKSQLGLLSSGRGWCFWERGIFTSCLCPLADWSNPLRLHSFRGVIEKDWQLQNVCSVPLGLFFPLLPLLFIFYFLKLFC